MRLGLRMGLNSRQGGGGDLPSLDLAFALDKTLTARKGPTPAFTRSSTATFVGSNGLIQSAAINEPRFDHDPVTGVCKGLLIEESRENLLARSNQFNTSPWAATAVTVAEVTGGGLDGGSAWRLTPTAADSSIGQTRTVAVTAAHTLSVWLKSDTGSNVTLSLSVYDIPANVNRGVKSITVTTQWQRFEITTSTVVAGNSTAFIIGAFGSWSTGENVLAFGAQLEAGAFPLSYIPTTSGTAARSADVCSIIGDDFSSFYNQVEGTLFANATPQAVDQGALVVGVNTTTSIASHLIYKTRNDFNGIGKRWGAQTVSVGAQTAIATSTDVAVSRANLSYAYKLNDFAFAYDGTIVGTDNSGTMPFPTAMRIGARDDGLQLNGHIARIQYFRKRLSNAKLQTITTP